MTDTAGNPEEERRSEFYQAPWIQEAVGRYVFSKVRVPTYLIISGIKNTFLWLPRLPGPDISASLYGSTLFL